MEIAQPLEELDWIPRPKILALQRLGITTAEDLLTHFPRRHEDRHQFPEFPRDESDVPVCLTERVRVRFLQCRLKNLFSISETPERRFDHFSRQTDLHVTLIAREFWKLMSIFVQLRSVL